MKAAVCAEPCANWRTREGGKRGRGEGDRGVRRTEGGRGGGEGRRTEGGGGGASERRPSVFIVESFGKADFEPRGIDWDESEDDGCSQKDC